MLEPGGPSDAFALAVEIEMHQAEQFKRLKNAYKDMKTRHRLRSEGINRRLVLRA